MKKLLILLGLADEPVPTTIKDVKFMSSVHPKDRPNLHDWCKEFNFGMLYDRRIIHMNQLWFNGENNGLLGVKS